MVEEQLITNKNTGEELSMSINIGRIIEHRNGCKVVVHVIIERKQIAPLSKENTK